MKFRFAAFPLLFILFCLCPAMAAESLDEMDETFLAARNATHAGDRARLERLAGKLRTHELAVYVDYWRLQLDLKGDLDPAAVMAFLAANEGDCLAEKVRGDWLKQLGQRRQWSLFDAEYPALARPDQELACYALQSRLARNDASALDEATPLWLNLIDPPDSCHPILEALIVDKRVLAGDVWARIRRLIENNRLTGARRDMNYLPRSQTPDAKTALAVTDAPLPWLGKTRLTNSRMHRELIALAIARIARRD
ncbi:MAG: lytic transglycosylase, partial [Candidatus Accumulibacter sp.]|nr:lytic transglycosylase [Accumulibacter sp.]